MWRRGACTCRRSIIAEKQGRKAVVSKQYIVSFVGAFLRRRCVSSNRALNGEEVTVFSSAQIRVDTKVVFLLFMIGAAKKGIVAGC